MFFSFLRQKRELARLIREIYFYKQEMNFWKRRALAQEEKREKERERAGRLLLLMNDRVLISKGAHPVRLQADKEDANGFTNSNPEIAAREKKLREEREQREWQSFLEDCLRHGKTEEEAREFWESKIPVHSA